MLISKVWRVCRKKMRKMAKNSKKTGHSARNGNCPAPYTKYKKRPWVYTFKRKKVDMPASVDSHKAERRAA